MLYLTLSLYITGICANKDQVAEKPGSTICIDKCLDTSQGYSFVYPDITCVNLISCNKTIFTSTLQIVCAQVSTPLKFMQLTNPSIKKNPDLTAVEQCSNDHKTYIDDVCINIESCFDYVNKICPQNVDVLKYSTCALKYTLLKDGQNKCVKSCREQKMTYTFSEKESKCGDQKCELSQTCFLEQSEDSELSVVSACTETEFVSTFEGANMKICVKKNTSCFSIIEESKDLPLIKCDFKKDLYLYKDVYFRDKCSEYFEKRCKFGTVELNTCKLPYSDSGKVCVESCFKENKIVFNNECVEYKLNDSFLEYFKSQLDIKEARFTEECEKYVFAKSGQKICLDKACSGATGANVAWIDETKAFAEVICKPSAGCLYLMEYDVGKFACLNVKCSEHSKFVKDNGEIASKKYLNVDTCVASCLNVNKFVLDDICDNCECKGKTSYIDINSDISPDAKCICEDDDQNVEFLILKNDKRLIANHLKKDKHVAVVNQTTVPTIQYEEKIPDNYLLFGNYAIDTVQTCAEYSQKCAKSFCLFDKQVDNKCYNQACPSKEFLLLDEFDSNSYKCVDSCGAKVVLSYQRTCAQKCDFEQEVVFSLGEAFCFPDKCKTEVLVFDMQLITFSCKVNNKFYNISNKVFLENYNGCFQYSEECDKANKKVVNSKLCGYKYNDDQICVKSCLEQSKYLDLNNKCVRQTDQYLNFSIVPGEAVVSTTCDDYVFHTKDIKLCKLKSCVKFQEIIINKAIPFLQCSDALKPNQVNINDVFINNTCIEYQKAMCVDLQPGFCSDVYTFEQKCYKTCRNIDGNQYNAQKEGDKYVCKEQCDTLDTLKIHNITINGIVSSEVECIKGCKNIILFQNQHICIDENVCNPSKSHLNDSFNVICNECIEGQALLMDNFCVSIDSDCKNLQKYCDESNKMQDYCQNEYYSVSDKGGQCLKNCNSGQFIEQINSKRCVDNCSDNYINNDSKVCMKECGGDYKYKKIEDNKKYCVKNCTPKRITALGQCTPSCDLYHRVIDDYIQCADNCGTDFYQTDESCVKSCNLTNQLTRSNRSCFDSGIIQCQDSLKDFYQDDLYYANEYTCVLECSHNQFKDSLTNKCEPSCIARNRKLQFSEIGSFCVDSCQNLTRLYTSKVAVEIQCTDVCLENEVILSNSTCSTSCSEENFKINNNGTCVNNCTYAGFIFSKEKNTCIRKCSENQKITENIEKDQLDRDIKVKTCVDVEKDDSIQQNAIIIGSSVAAVLVILMIVITLVVLKKKGKIFVKAPEPISLAQRGHATHFDYSGKRVKVISKVKQATIPERILQNKLAMQNVHHMQLSQNEQQKQDVILRGRKKINNENNNLKGSHLRQFD